MIGKIVSCLAVLALVCGMVAIAFAQGPESVTFNTVKKDGTLVVFPHKAHQERIDCATCHHTKNADGTKGPYAAGQEENCTICHELGKPSDYMHRLCRGCHLKGGAGPTACADCHKH